MTTRTPWFGTAVALIALLGPAPAVADALDQAYQREISFLTTELRALERQESELELQYHDRIGTGRDQLEGLQARLERLELQAEDLDRQLLDLEIAEEGAAERADLLASTLEQARISLRDHGMDPGSDDLSAGALARLFEQAGEVIDQRSSVRAQEGEFFLTDGQATRGTIWHVGGVAAYGVADTGAGALIPVEGGAWRLADRDLESTARDLDAGRLDGLATVVLFDAQGQVADEKQGKSLIQFISAGGVIGWIIVSLGILGIGMGFLRALLLWRSRTDVDGLLRDMEPLVRDHDLAAAGERARQESGAAARVVEATLPVLPEDTERVENAAGEAVLEHLPVLERFGPALTVIAAVAPLLGLLGTVTGMISTFEVITEFGTGDPKMLSGGISEALVTTELGLIVAIPVLMLGTLLGARSQRMVSSMEKAVLHLSNVYGTPSPLGHDPEGKRSETERSDDSAEDERSGDPAKSDQESAA